MTAPRFPRDIALLAVALVAIVAFFGYQVLKEQRRIGNNSRAPEPPKVASTDPVRGNPQARITIIEFADFQCPFCRSEQPSLSVLLAKYRDRVRLVWKDFPLPELHGESVNAAEAARCAGEQGKFWEMHDELFLAQERIGERLYGELAARIGLNTKAFDACRASDRMLERINESLQAGILAGIDGTPSYFIEGQRFDELPDSSVMEQLLAES